MGITKEEVLVALNRWKSVAGTSQAAYTSAIELVERLGAQKLPDEAPEGYVRVHVAVDVNGPTMDGSHYRVRAQHHNGTVIKGPKAHTQRRWVVADVLAYEEPEVVGVAE